jgi:hypothetical protein
VKATYRIFNHLREHLWLIAGLTPRGRGVIKAHRAGFSFISHHSLASRGRNNDH